MKTKLMTMALLAGSSLFAAPRVAIGVGIGVPVAPVYVAPCPGPGYVWINGAWVFRGVRPGYFHGPFYHGRDFRHR